VIVVSGVLLVCAIIAYARVFFFPRDDGDRQRSGELMMVVLANAALLGAVGASAVPIAFVSAQILVLLLASYRNLRTRASTRLERG
jgi:hypothetical protein